MKATFRVRRSVVLWLAVAGVFAFAAPRRAAAESNPFVVYKAKDSQGKICSAAKYNAGAVCTSEAECGGTERETRFCVAKSFVKGRRVRLVDRFESGVFDLKPPLALAAPSAAVGLPSGDLRIVLDTYGIALAKTKPAQAPHVKRTRLVVRDPFHPPGSELIVDTTKPDRLLVPTSWSDFAPIPKPDPAEHAVDAYKCYAVKRSRGTGKFAVIRDVAVSEPFAPDTRRYDLKKPTRLCVAVEVASEAGGDAERVEQPSAALQCYQVALSTTPPKQVKHQKTIGLFLGNRFGPDRVDTVRESELCVPAQLDAAGGCEPGTSRACYDGPPETEDVGLCRGGTQTCALDGSYGPCTGQVLPSDDLPGNGIDEDCDGVDLPVGPGIPPSTVTVDPTVRVDVTQIEGFDGAAPRPVTALTDRSGIPMHFVANELIVVGDDVGAAAAVAARWGGTLVRSFDPASVGLPGSAQHLLRVVPSYVDEAQLIADLRTLEPSSRNDLRLASETGLRLLAAAAREAAAGTTVALNLVLTPDGFEDRTTTEHVDLGFCPTPPPPTPTPGPTPAPTIDGCVREGVSPGESFRSDAYTWSYIQAGGMQRIGVGEAWRALSLAGRLDNEVPIAVLDGGFVEDAVDNPEFTAYLNAVNPLQPNVYPANDVPCGGKSCPWHGVNVVSAAMGPADDGKGAAGPAGPVAKALTIRRSQDVFGTATAFTTTFLSPARIVNMSFGERIPATLSFVVVPFEAITAAAWASGKLLIASAGNESADVDSEDCVPVIGSPCWEDAWWTPCENLGVLCVGALAGNATSRASFSNWGREDVDLFGPGTVWVGGDPGDPEPHAVNGTSFAAPFVAGVAALVMAANPDLTSIEVEQALIQTAWPSGDPDVRRYVDAQGAVNLALGGSPICTPPRILSLTPDRTSAPCLRNDFAITHTSTFGPFTYQWRRLVPGTGTRVALVDGGNVSGATTDHLVLDPLLPSDEGQYDVVVSNICGSTTSGLISVKLVDGQLVRAPSLPEPRGVIGMAFDRARERMVSFGGISPRLFGTQTRFPETTDTWERDGSGVWQVVTDGAPPRRTQAAMAYDEARGVSVLFGGTACGFDQFFCPWGDPSGRIFYHDTWEWNGTTWNRASFAGPSYHRFHSMAYDSVRQRVVTYGGTEESGVTGRTLYEWDGTSWTPRPTTPDPVHGFPPPVLPSPIAFDRARNTFVLFLYWETWELDGAGQWHRRAVHGNRNVSGSGWFGFVEPGSMVHDSDRGRTLLYTILNTSPTTNTGALWEWTGSTWLRKITAPLPVSEGIAIEYDSGRRRTVLASTGRGTLLSDDVFEWRFFADDPTCSLGPPL